MLTQPNVEEAVRRAGISVAMLMRWQNKAIDLEDIEARLAQLERSHSCMARLGRRVKAM